MTNKEKLLYLSNVVFIAGTDHVISEAEAKAIEIVRQQIGASKSDLKKALHAVSHGSHQLTPFGRVSDKVRNLEDMIFVAISDGEISKSEKPEILAFAKTTKISQDQFSEILSGAKLRMKSQKTTMTCTSCEKEISSDSIFCSECGHRVVSS
jgi:Zn finger protein HypA/HybF involved in hydrogenase expression